MERKVAEAIVAACESKGIEARIYEDYSGRGMYGDTTTAVTADCDTTDVLAAAISNPHLFKDIDIGSLRSDSLGLRMIFY